jgi:glycosidase
MSIETPPCWISAVVYQIYQRSFDDSTGNGIGYLDGIRGTLDYLQQLGVDVVWLSPTYRSPQADSGYDIIDYQDIDPLFGSLGDFDTVPLQLADLTRSLGRWQTGLAAAGWNSLYFSNHDQPRSVSRFGGDGQFRYESVTLLATILHLHRGAPCIDQGDEIGMTNAGFITIEECQDLESLGYYDEEVAAGPSPAAVLASLAFRSRDNARTPVPWDATPGAGFPTGTPWPTITPNHATINVATDRASGSRSIFEFYRRLIALRHGSSVVSLGDFEMLEPEHPTLYAFTRSLGGETLMVVVKFSSEPLELPLAAARFRWRPGHRRPRHRQLWRGAGCRGGAADVGSAGGSAGVSLASGCLVGGAHLCSGAV